MSDAERYLALTKRHGDQLRLTPAGRALMDQLLAELCAKHTPGNELTEIINQKIGVNWTRGAYWHRVADLGFDWTRSKRRPPQVPPEELPMCSHCRKVRMPVLYKLSNKPGPTLLLCEKRCCPDCGGNLEVHTVLDKATGKPATKYWAHALPLLPRNCAVCDKHFTPANAKQAHKMTCSDRCMAIFATRNWQKSHPDEVRKYNKQGGERRRVRMLPANLGDQPKSYQRIVPVLVTSRALGKVLLNRQVFELAGLTVSLQTMNRIRQYCHVPGPRGGSRKSL